MSPAKRLGFSPGKNRDNKGACIYVCVGGGGGVGGGRAALSLAVKHSQKITQNSEDMLT